MSELRNMKKSLSDINYKEMKKINKKQKNGLIYYYYTATRNDKLFNITIIITSIFNEYYDCIIDEV